MEQEKHHMKTKTKFTLGEAATITNKSKPTISRDLKSGKLSGIKQDNGQWSIDLSELERVYELTEQDQSTKRSVKHSMKQNETFRETPHETLNELIELRVKVKLLEERLNNENKTIEDLRNRLDREAERLDKQLDEHKKMTLLLTDQSKPRKASKPFFAWLIKEK